MTLAASELYLWIAIALIGSLRKRPTCSAGLA